MSKPKPFTYDETPGGYSVLHDGAVVKRGLDAVTAYIFCADRNAHGPHVDKWSELDRARMRGPDRANSKRAHAERFLSLGLHPWDQREKPAKDPDPPSAPAVVDLEAAPPAPETTAPSVDEVPAAEQKPARKSRKKPA